MEPTTGTKRPSEEDEQTKSMKKLVTVDPNLTVQSLFTYQFGPLRNIIRYLDPGIDWPTCRKVCTSWHQCILSEEKELKHNDIQLWTGDVIPIYPTNPSSYVEAIQADRDLVRRTTKEERQKYVEEMNREHRRDGGYDSDDSDEEDWEYSVDDLDAYQKWVRLDVEPNEKGECNIEGGIARKETSVAKAKIHFLCRNAYVLLDRLESKFESKSKFIKFISRFHGPVSSTSRYCYSVPTVETASQPFFFAGAYWRACVGVKQDLRFGVRLERLFPCSEFICSRRGIECPTVDNDLSAFVRYKASFSVDSEEICKNDFVCRSASYAQIESYDSCDHWEQIPLYAARFALGPSTPDLRISIKLEFMGYNYFQD